ncbi:DUF998 domain-containing protein [Pseudonocardia sp. GCM10023141]|uniref:DUF998 domain-containing protein n=1 Tax=Pseudonocardia sp. GCM10023141 TaxID=3252653 RepID=UPI003612065D
MMRIGDTGQGPGRTWSGAGLAAAFVVVALLPMTYLHVIGAAVVDPFVTTISDYVGVPGGFALLAVAAGSLALAALVLAGGLAPAGLPRPDGPARMLASGAAALVVVALFPTNYPGTPVGIVANVHRVAGAWVFLSLPLACWLIARRAREASNWRPTAPALSWCAGITGVVSAVFLLSHLPMVLSDSLVVPLQGGLERVLYALVMLSLLATARALRFAVVGARSTAPVRNRLQTPAGDFGTGDLGRAA